MSVLVLVSFLLGCDGDHLTDGSDPVPATGTITADLTIRMTDTQVLDASGRPFEPERQAEWTAVLADDLSIEGEDGWVPVTTEIGWLEVRDLLEDARFELGQGTIDEGFYSGIRITAEEAAIVVDNVEYALSIEAGQVAGFTTATDFCLFEDDEVALELTWELASNVREGTDGQYVLTPVMAVDGAPHCEQ